MLKHVPLLFLSGTHGDEAIIINYIHNSIQKYQPTLPDFIFIPELSPSAVKQQTRHNSDGIDINRYFFDDSPYQEIRSIMENLSRNRYSWCIDFHMDLEYDSFYMYENIPCDQNILFGFQTAMKNHLLPLFTGIDDPTDPTLNIPIIDGYVAYQGEWPGMTWQWLLDHQLTDRITNLEIPGKASSTSQQKMIDLFFSDFLIPSLHSSNLNFT